MIKKDSVEIPEKGFSPLFIGAGGVTRRSAAIRPIIRGFSPLFIGAGGVT